MVRIWIRIETIEDPEHCNNYLYAKYSYTRHMLVFMHYEPNDWNELANFS